MGFMMGFAVGMAAGVMFGTFSCIRVGMRGRELMGGVAKMMMMQSGGTFSTFMSIGMDICYRDHIYQTYLITQWDFCNNSYSHVTLCPRTMDKCK
uniref:Reactive oxygen species modulator 1 n=1 Tax=Hucho hucho TaxID=62062 RepID=A0A4W5PCW1_9TELE